MRWVSRRMLAATVVIGWLAAPLCALGLGLHLVDDHHGPQSIDLAVVGTHGHHHDAVTAEHDHPAIPRASQSTAPQPLACTIGVALACSKARPAASAVLEAAPPPTGSPPLFYTHCALLL